MLLRSCGIFRDRFFAIIQYDGVKGLLFLYKRFYFTLDKLEKIQFDLYKSVRFAFRRLNDCSFKNHAFVKLLKKTTCF